jgi:hypothetical protein
MNNLSLIEEYFKKYISDLDQYLHDGVIDVSLDLLNTMGLLDFQHGVVKEDDSLTRYFHVIESIEKITLINEHFVIWIVPDSFEGKPVTYTLIALANPSGPQLEMAFCTAGVYNNSPLVLKILEKYLIEIQENESLIKNYKKTG